MRVLFISSEIFPFAKSGGLGDVASSLPKALNAYVDTTSIMPLYSLIDCEKHSIESTNFKYEFWVGSKEYQFEVFRCEKTLFLKESSGLFDRDEMYGDYDDNDIRFGVFCYGVLEFIRVKNEHFDILHINDWQSALIALLVKEHYHFNSKIVFTIHNLAYQGIFSKQSIDRLSLRWDYFRVSKLEYHDQINLLKSAIVYSDIVTTVSPTYAKEIQTKRFGCDLENLIQDNEYKLRGILNGIDYDEFHPAIDKYIPINFDLDTLYNKKALKIEVLKELHLQDEDRALFVFIGRFTAQKGIDQILNSLYELSNMPINIAILGSGEDEYNHWFSSLSSRYKNISITIGYSETLARKLYGAADFLYMPSQYEPCGLNQMIAMKYGTLAIVKKVGGLKDSVIDFEEVLDLPLSKGVGITFEDESVQSFIYVTKKALNLYHNKSRFDEIISYNMQVDFSWLSKSKEYFELYKELSDGWLPERKIKEFEIPTHYDIDTLKAICVNPNTLFTYFEITHKLLKKHQISLDALKLKLFVDGLEVESVDVYDRVGDYYFYHKMDFAQVMTKIGYIDKDAKFISILKSNIFIAPNSKVIKNSDIIWRNLSTKEFGYKDALYFDDLFYEKRETLSSDALLKTRALQKLSKQISDKSSFTLVKKEEM